MFVEWKGDLTGNENPKQITIDVKTVTAVFIKKQYSLTIEKEGEGTVTEKVIKAGVARNDYNSGTILELTATGESGWEFKEWKGDLTGSDNPKQITIDKAKTVKAVFESLPPFYLDANGVTIKAKDWVTVGTTEKLNGVSYVAVDKSQLKSMIKNKEDVTKVVTTLITDMSRLINDNFNTSTHFNQDISTWDVQCN